MAEVDTSSYRLPTQPSALDTLGKLQGLQQGAQQIQSNNIGISKQQLDLANSRFNNIIKEVNSLPPEAGIQDYFKLGQNAVNQGIWTPENYTQFVNTVPTDASQLPAFKQQFLAKALNTQEIINWHYGQQQNSANGQTVTPGLTSNRPGFNNGNAFKATSQPIQQQIPPQAGVINSNNEPTMQGPTPAVTPQGTVSQPTPPVNTSPLPVGPASSPAIRGPSANFGGNVTGVDVGPNTASPLPVQPPSSTQRVAQGFPAPSGPRTGQAPGVAEGANIAGSESGKQLALARNQAASYQRDIFPLQQAIPDLEKLGTKGTGPGTETINNLKSFVLSNVPGISDKDPAFASVPTYDKAKKYLTDFVNQTGNSGTNDKLAAAFAGNPSTHISNAAAVDVAKSALSLRRMQQAQTQQFERLGLPASSYSSWIAKNNNEMDPRAFGVDMMSKDAQVKLNQSLKGKERDRFEKSLEIAHGLGFVTPQQAQ